MIFCSINNDFKYKLTATFNISVSYYYKTIFPNVIRFLSSSNLQLTQHVDIYSTKSKREHCCMELIQYIRQAFQNIIEFQIFNLA